MEFANRLYIGTSIRHRAERIIDRMKQGKVVISVYCITEAGNSTDLFDIYHYHELRQEYYKEHPVKILGLAGSKEEAIGIVANMIQRKLH